MQRIIKSEVVSNMGPRIGWKEKNGREKRAEIPQMKIFTDCVHKLDFILSVNL
jgi:hypothetical protein